MRVARWDFWKKNAISKNFESIHTSHLTILTHKNLFGKQICSANKKRQAKKLKRFIVLCTWKIKKLSLKTYPSKLFCYQLYPEKNIPFILASSFGTKTLRLHFPVLHSLPVYYCIKTKKFSLIWNLIWFLENFLEDI